VTDALPRAASLDRRTPFQTKIRKPRLRDLAPLVSYNLRRLHRTLPVTPAMAAGVTKRLREMADNYLVEIPEAWGDCGRLGAFGILCRCAGKNFAVRNDFFTSSIVIHGSGAGLGRWM